MSFDERLLIAARTWAHTPARERAVERFSRLGEHSAVWLAIGLAGGAVEPQRRARWGRATATVLATYAVNTALKLLVRRTRPQPAGLPALTSTPTRLSFPSAHASTSFAGAHAYSRLGLPGAPLYALALALSCSRLYLGVHYPSDILAGALLGTAVAAAREREADALVPFSANASSTLAGASSNGLGPGSNGHGPEHSTQAAGGRS
jgi:membrane-associated phospholipid phosphatase